MRLLLGVAVALCLSLLTAPQNEPVQEDGKHIDSEERGKESELVQKVEAEKAEAKSNDKPKADKPTWRDNPNDCDLKTQFVREDNLECVDKPKQPKQEARSSSQSSGSCEDYRHLVERYDWNVDVALAVMQAESGCNPNAANLNDNHGQCIGSFGLMQLACFWTDNPHDPEENIAKAYEIYSRSGWTPWGVCTNGSVKCS